MNTAVNNNGPEDSLAKEIAELKATAAEAMQKFKEKKAKRKNNKKINKEIYKELYEQATTVMKCLRQLNLPQYGLSYFERYQNSKIIEEHADCRHYWHDSYLEYFQILYYWKADKHQAQFHWPEGLKPLYQCYYRSSWGDELTKSIRSDVEIIFQTVVPFFLEDPLLEPEDREYLWGRITAKAAGVVLSSLSGEEYFFSGFIKLIEERMPAWLNKYPADKELILRFCAQVLPAFRKAYLRNHTAKDGFSNNRGVPDTPAVREGFFQWYLKGVDFLAEHANTPELKEIAKNEYEAVPSGTYAAGMAQLRLLKIAKESAPEHFDESLYYAKAHEEFQTAAQKDYSTEAELPKKFRKCYCLYDDDYSYEKPMPLPGFDKLAGLNNGPSIIRDKRAVANYIKARQMAGTKNVSGEPSPSYITPLETEKAKAVLQGFTLSVIIKAMLFSEHKEDFEKIMSEIEDENDELRCPIGQTLMAEPVYYEINGKKQRFNKPEILEWQKNNRVCPLTRGDISNVTLCTDAGAENKIKELIIEKISKSKKNWELGQLLEDLKRQEAMAVQRKLNALLDKLERLKKQLDGSLGACLSPPSISCAQHDFRSYENNSIHIWFDNENKVEELLVINHKGEGKRYGIESISKMGLAGPINQYIISPSRSDSESKALALDIQNKCQHLKPAASPEAKSFIAQYNEAETELAAQKQFLLNKKILTQESLKEIEDGAYDQRAKFHPAYQELYSKKMREIKFDKTAREMTNDIVKIREEYERRERKYHSWIKNGFGLMFTPLFPLSVPIMVVIGIINAIDFLVTEGRKTQKPSEEAKTLGKWEDELNKEINKCPEERLKLTFFGCKKMMNEPSLNDVKDVVRTIEPKTMGR